MVGVVEVDTDRSLRGRRPEAGPGPLGRPVGQGDAQIVLRREQRSGLRVVNIIQLVRAGGAGEVGGSITGA